MTGEAWPPADPRLERHYRRLLLAYSGRYRRRHGTEIVTMLLEMAGPGRTRPSAAESWHLIASGVRQRFRLPAGRPFARVAAILVTVTTMAAGAAAGSWAGERTLAAVPSQAAIEQLLTAAVVDPDPGRVMPPMRLSENGNADLVILIGSPSSRHPGTPATIAEGVRDRIAASGWTITKFNVTPPYGKWTAADAGMDTRFDAGGVTAERDGLILNGRVSYSFDSDANAPVYLSDFSAHLFAARTGAYLPLTLAGGVLGALAGWLLAAAFAGRSRGLGPARRRAVALSTGTALAAAGLPVLAVLRNAGDLVLHLTDTRFPVFTPYSVLWPGGEAGGPLTWLVPACAAAALAAGLLAALSSSDRAQAARERAPG